MYTPSSFFKKSFRVLTQNTPLKLNPSIMILPNSFSLLSPLASSDNKFKTLWKISCLSLKIPISSKITLKSRGRKLTLLKPNNLYVSTCFVWTVIWKKSSKMKTNIVTIVTNLPNPVINLNIYSKMTTVTPTATLCSPSGAKKINLKTTIQKIFNSRNKQQSISPS